MARHRWPRTQSRGVDIGNALPQKSATRTTCLEMVRYTKRRRGEENEEWGKLAGDVLQGRGDENVERGGGTKKKRRDEEKRGCSSSCRSTTYASIRRSLNRIDDFFPFRLLH